MKNFRVAWFAIIEDESVLEGRSLIEAESPEKAIEELYANKTQEYRLKPAMITISSVIELQN